MLHLLESPTLSQRLRTDTRLPHGTADRPQTASAAPAGLTFQTLAA